MTDIEEKIRDWKKIRSFMKWIGELSVEKREGVIILDMMLKNYKEKYKEEYKYNILPTEKKDYSGK